MPPVMSRIKFPHIMEPTQRAKVRKYFMTFFCTLFLLFGFSITVCGSVLAEQRLSDCGFFAHFYTGVYLLLAAGVATCVFSLLCCFKVRRSSSTSDLVPLLVVPVVVVVLEVMSAVASHIAYVMASGGELAQLMVDAWSEFYQDGAGDSCVDGIQDKYSCCGVENYTEWILISSSSGTTDLFPSSCLCDADKGTSSCLNVTVSFDPNSTRPSSHYLINHAACGGLVLSQLVDTLLVPRVVGPVVAFVEVLFFLMMGYLLYRIDNHSLVGSYIVQDGGGITVISSVPNSRLTVLDSKRTLENGAGVQGAGGDGVAGGGYSSGVERAGYSSGVERAGYSSGVERAGSALSNGRVVGRVTWHSANQSVSLSNEEPVSTPRGNMSA